MKRAFNLICYLIFMLLMVATFTKLDYIVGHFVKTETNDLQIVDFSEYEMMSKDPVYYAIDPIRFEEDDFETIKISGRCCTDTESENSQKTVTVLFKSASICYASERRTTLGAPLADAAKAFGYNHNFSRSIALLPLQEGTYDIYLFDKENEKNYGLVDLNISIVKDQNGIRMKERTIFAEIEFDPQEAQPAMQSWLDYVEERDGLIWIEGWITAQEQETLGQKVFLEVQLEEGPRFVECTPVVRTGVGEVLKNHLYDYSGYICRIAAEDPPSEGFEFRIYMQNDTGIYTDGILHCFDSASGAFQ